MRTFWITLTILCALVLIAGEFEAFGQQLPDASHRLPAGMRFDPGGPIVIDSSPIPPHAKLIAPTEWQPTHKHLKFITNHPTRTAILGIAGAMVAGYFIKRTPHCSHYEAGHNGVDVPCPAEYGK